jgi:hypothetical protein
MGTVLPRDVAASFDELARAARDLSTMRHEQHGPLDADDPLDAAIARLLRYVEQVEAETA